MTSATAVAPRKGGDIIFGVGAGQRCLAAAHTGRHNTQAGVYLRTNATAPLVVLQFDDDGTLWIGEEEIESSVRTLEALGIFRGWLFDARTTGFDGSVLVARLAGHRTVSERPFTFTTGAGDSGAPAGSFAFTDTDGEALRLDPDGSTFVRGKRVSEHAAGIAFLRWVLG